MSFLLMDRWAKGWERQAYDSRYHEVLLFWFVKITVPYKIMFLFWGFSKILPNFATELFMANPFLAQWVVWTQPVNCVNLSSILRSQNMVLIESTLVRFPVDKLS